MANKRICLAVVSLATLLLLTAAHSRKLDAEKSTVSADLSRTLSLAGVNAHLQSLAAAYLESEVFAAELLSAFMKCVAGCGVTTCIDQCANAAGSSTLPSTAASTAASNNENQHHVTIVNNVNTLNMGGGHNNNNNNNNNVPPPSVPSTTTPTTPTTTTTTPTTPTTTTTTTTTTPQQPPKLKSSIHFFNGYGMWRVGDYPQVDASKFGTVLREYQTAMQPFNKDVRRDGLILALGGYASFLGTSAPNRILSERRVKSVACYLKEYLTRQSINDFEFRMGYFGSDRSTVGGNQQQQHWDRRVDIFFPENDEANSQDLQRFIWRGGKYADQNGGDGGINNYCSQVNWKSHNFNNNFLQ